MVDQGQRNKALACAMPAEQENKRQLETRRERHLTEAHIEAWLAITLMEDTAEELLGQQRSEGTQ